MHGYRGVKPGPWTLLISAHEHRRLHLPAVGPVQFSGAGDRNVPGGPLHQHSGRLSQAKWVQKFILLSQLYMIINGKGEMEYSFIKNRISEEIVLV